MQPIKSNKTKSYKVWKSMMKRCYSKRVHLHHPNYKDCKVCNEWLDYLNFAIWFEKNYIEGYTLDKDILIKNNKVYSPNTCSFVPNEINSLFSSKRNINNLPSGVRLRKNGNYQSRIYTNGKERVLGTFSTKEKAFLIYKEEKEKHIKIVAEKWKEKISEKVYYAMLNYTINE